MSSGNIARTETRTVVRAQRERGRALCNQMWLIMMFNSLCLNLVSADSPRKKCVCFIYIAFLIWYKWPINGLI